MWPSQIRTRLGENLLEWEKGVLTVLDWEGLKLAGEFDPAYLHQDRSHLAA